MAASLAECVEAFGVAWAKRDLQTLESLLAPEYVHTDFEGRVLRRAEWLTYARAHQHGSTIEFHDIEVSEHGDFGIVIGANNVAGGTMGSTTIRFTQVWRRTEQGWKRVAFQATEVRR